MDAAVTAAAVLNVTEPHMTGIGGDLFAMLWSVEENRLVGLDASGRSGSGTDARGLRDEGARNAPVSGARSVTVPGALSGWQALLDEYGTLTMTEALAPAVRIADEGFPVTPIVARDWAEHAALLRQDPGAAATYLPGDEAPRVGEWVSNPDLASSFRAIARGGAEALYGGELGRRIVDGLRKLGGYLTLDDLADHEHVWVEPISVDYKGHALHELPPAGQGIAALQMLKMLEGFDVRRMCHNSAAYLHTLIEAKKLAHADLARYVADPEHMSVRTEALLDSDYLADRAGVIDPTTASDLPEAGRLFTDSETIYLTVGDQQGNMVSLINSLAGYFGSGVVVPGTGIMLQNRASGFTLEEGHPNGLAPNKRPLHTIIPAFVTRRGEPYLSFGVMGGSMQPQGQVQVLLNLLEFDMDLQEAIDAPRFRHLEGKAVAVEQLDPEVAGQLRRLGHHLVAPSATTFGGGQAVLKLERGWAAGSDPRKDGMAAGH